MLAEARGYRLSMVLAHQHLGQFPKELRDAVSANARTKVWFSMSPEDAHALSRHVAPEVSEHDLSHLGAYTAAARLVADGEETPAFTLRTRPAPPPQPGRADAVRAANRAAHHRPRTEAAKPLAGRTLPGSTVTPAATATVAPAAITRADDLKASANASGAVGAIAAARAAREVRARSDPGGVQQGLHEGLRPGLEPSGPAEPPAHGAGEGSTALADSMGRWV